MQHADWEEEQREERWRAVTSDGRVRDKTGREKGQNCKVRMEETETKRSSACSSELQDKTLSHSFRKWWKDRTANQTWGLDNWGRDRGYQVRRGRQTSSILVLPAEGDLSTSGQARGMVQEIYTGSYSNIQTFKHFTAAKKALKLCSL